MAADAATGAVRRNSCIEKQFASVAVPVVDIHIAQEKARLGDLDGAIELSRTVLDGLFDSSGWIWNTLATSAVVETLLQRNEERDVEDAQSALDRLASVPTDPGFVLKEITLLRLRALLARAHADETAYRDYRDRYRDMARTLGFEGHIAWAEAMT